MRATPLFDDTLLESYERQQLWQHTTLWHEILGHDADRVAVVCPRQGRVTFGELRAEAEGLAAAWFADGLQPGEVVGTQLPNWYEALLVHLALTRLGAISMGLLPTLVEQEIAYIADQSNMVGLVAAPGYRTTPGQDAFDRLIAVTQSLRWVISADDPASLRKLATAGDPTALPLPPDPDDVALLMATSGTTGEPKLVMHSHRSTVGGSMQQIAEIMSLDADDVMLMPSSVAHASGLQYGLRMAAHLGATLVLQDQWDAVRCAELVDRHRVTWIMGATPFLFDVLQIGDDQLKRLSSLRIFVCGGAPIPRDVAQKATERLPKVSLLAAWGMSETGIATIVRPGDPLDKVTGTDGAPAPGWEFRIVDPETGQAVGAGEEGEIQCRGAALFHGYLGRPDFTREAFPDGWLRTGDLGRQDADGYIRCLGRIKDLIIRGGVNISVAEVEDAVRRHHAVKDVAVVGMLDDRLGERICAVVVADGESAPTVPELTEFLLSQGFSRQKLPERIVEVDELPRTMTGKVQKYKLRQQVS